MSRLFYILFFLLILSVAFVGFKIQRQIPSEPSVTIQTSATSTQKVPVGYALVQMEARLLDRNAEMINAFKFLSKQIQEECGTGTKR